jgi:hypothetical protein
LLSHDFLVAVAPLSGTFFSLSFLSAVTLVLTFCLSHPLARPLCALILGPAFVRLQFAVSAVEVCVCVWNLCVFRFTKEVSWQQHDSV